MATQRKPSKTRKTTTQSPKSAPIEESRPKSDGSSKKRRMIFGAVLLTVALLALLYTFRGLFLAALVNGEPITRLSIVKESEKQGGKQILDNLVTRTLILQEAKKQNVTIPQGDIDKEIKKLETEFSQQGQKLTDLLSSRGMTRGDLEDQIRPRLIIEKILGKEVAVTDKEVADYLEKNKELIPEGASSTDTQTNVKEQLRQQKINEKFQPWVENLKKNSKINYFVSY